jgi:hypothetical protein
MGIGKNHRQKVKEAGGAKRHKHHFDDFKPPLPKKVPVTVQDGKPRFLTRRQALEMKKRGEKVEFAKLTFTSSKHRGSMLSMRTKDESLGDSSALNSLRIKTNLVTATDKKAYKQGTTRIHWKGGRDSSDKTTGLTPFITQRDGQGWSTEHEQARTKLSKDLMKRPGFTPLDNSSSRWGAENSHLVAGSLWAPNDALSAPAASVHQNTEWLAIEEGIKKLSGRSDLGGDLRFKATGYVHESGDHKGTLKAARFKIYVGGKKVFDHLTDGQRGNIDKREAKALKSQVSELRGTAPAVDPEHSKHFGGKGTAKGVVGKPPTLDQVKGTGSRLPSESSPMFTDVRSSKGATLTGSQAKTHVTDLFK